MYQFTTIQKFILLILPVLFAITVHEVAHGWMALRRGDKTALMLGRLTLNPIKHIDLIGTIILPIIMYFSVGFIFGWAKPVPVTWQNLKNPKRDMAWVALAGPMANLLMALGWALAAKIGLMINNTMPLTGAILYYMGNIGILINVVLMILNLIPIPPLDGSKIVASILPKRMEWGYSRMEPYGIIILLVLMISGWLPRLLKPVLMSFFSGISAVFGI
jgi:Zn-dependent protease